MEDDPEEVHDRHHEELNIKRQKVNHGEARDDGTPALDCAAKRKEEPTKESNRKNEREAMQKNRNGIGRSKPGRPPRGN